jgi:uncharacterized protein YbcC (UPF0753/DUF2309 family)
MISLLLEELAHYLPSQGPLKTFVHHNTLHNFEGLEFFEALEVAGKLYGAKRSLSESFYQDQLRSGRIAYSDMNKWIDLMNLPEVKWPLPSSRRKFVRDYCKQNPGYLTEQGLRWRLLEQEQLFKFTSGVTQSKRREIFLNSETLSSTLIHDLFAHYTTLCGRFEWSWLVAGIPEYLLDKSNNAPLLEGEILPILWMASVVLGAQWFEDLGEHYEKVQAPTSLSAVDQLVNPYLIKFTASFLDTGLAHLALSDRKKGLLSVFLSHVQNSSPLRPPWITDVFSKYETKNSIDVILDILDEKRIPKESWRDFLLEELLKLKGWAGLAHQTELGVQGFESRTSLSDFIAVRLILESLAENWIEVHPSRIKLRSSETIINDSSKDQEKAQLLFSHSYHLFLTFQMLPCSVSRLIEIWKSCSKPLRDTILPLSLHTRLPLWQKAYEWNLYSKFANALITHNQRRRTTKELAKCQVVCCIDDREESFRRYLEEINDGYETVGTAGFFGVDAEFHSLYEQPAAYCPANIVPSHMVRITPREGSERRLLGLLKAKSLRTEWDIYIEMKSRSLLRGWILALGGLLALVPLSLSTLAPRTMHKIRIAFRKRLLDANEESAVQFADGDFEGEIGGFTVQEMALRVRVLLTTTGLRDRLTPLVIIMGHGSFSSNNPYRSAYDCGACGGRPGRLNSRVFALMANSPEVRRLLSAEGLSIPPTTHFIGAYHNTCTDEVEYFEHTSIPETHLRLFQQVRNDIDKARALNAFERCRRFDDVSIRDVDKALAHVESRAHHIAQPRPEYGHATNAICVVGKRELTQGLFLDRRAFLVSYDDQGDHTGDTLQNLLRAVIPVCMGINLEYFFSSLDNQVYGAGSKLPHNITSLLGLMTGYCSDLRTGLPAQMIEIHEPVRLLVVIQREPNELLNVIQREPQLAKITKNGWIQLMSYSTEENRLFFFNSRGVFEEYRDVPSVLERVASSKDWVDGKINHLEFVQISGK